MASIIAIALTLVQIYSLKNYTPILPSKNQKLLKTGLFTLNFLTGVSLGFIFLWLQVFSQQNSLNSDSSAFSYESSKNHAWFELKVVSLVKLQQTQRYSRFNFNAEVEQITFGKEGANPNRFDESIKNAKLKVYWYLSSKEFAELPQSPSLGQHWVFKAKFKPNHASFNPSIRDYESWLLQQGIQGKLIVSGYKAIATQSNFPNGTLSHNATLLEAVEKSSFSALRKGLSHYFNELFAGSDFNGLYRALILGDKSAVKTEEWTLFQNTGTVHLMVISGLHMTIIATLAYLFAKLLWWLFVYRIEAITLPVFASTTAVLASALYLLISGAAIPTQRAFIMVATVLVFLMLKRHFQPFSALAMAALLIVLWDPFAVLSSGFWLSFCAVVLIFWGLQVSSTANSNENAVVKTAAKTRAKALERIQRFIFIQFILSIGLLPIIAWHYHTLPLMSLAANLIAVPFVTVIGLPLLLISSLLGILSSALALEFVYVTDQLWALLFDYLHWLNNLLFKPLAIPEFSVVWLIFYYAVFGLILKLAKSLVPFRFFYLGILLILALFTTAVLGFIKFTAVNSISPEEALITVLDVGQGQAVMVQTQNHTVLYDTGAKWGRETDAAKIVILPFLKARGIHNLDQLIISHSDSDHAGGVESILKGLKVKQQLSGQAFKMNQYLAEQKPESWQTQPAFKQCIAGDSWQFDKVSFEFIAPTTEQLKQGINNDNDHSCVLRVRVGSKQILIMGDASDKIEKQIMQNQLNNHEQTSMLIAGHHGSKYSTSALWLQAIKPRFVVFSAGYGNRFNFPSADVIKRIENSEQNIDWFNTACSGALVFKLNKAGVKNIEETRKTQRKWYHHRCHSSQQGILYQ